MSLPPAVLDPIAGENPGGANLRYAAVYDQIKHARREEDELPQGEWKRERKTADYAQVVKLATEALAKQSKDLQIAVWLTEALLHRQGFAGLRAGLDLLRELLERFWDHLYPELDDGDAGLRTAPLDWLGGYLGGAVRSVPLTQAGGHSYVAYKMSRAVGYEEEVKGDSARAAAREEGIRSGKLTPEEFDDAFQATPKGWYRELVADLDGSLEALDALDLRGQELFGNDAPGYLKLRDALKEVRNVAGQLLDRKLETDPDPVAEEPAAEVAAEDSGPGAADQGSAASPEQGAGAAADQAAGGSRSASNPAPAAGAEPRSREEAAAAVGAAARYLRRESPASPAPYLLVRGLRWGELRAGGDPIDPKLLAAPSTAARTRLKTMLLDEDWAALLDAGEEVMATPCGRGWLDLQRYVLRACEELGYEAVADAVRGALRGLLRDVPELTASTLMDDSPTANAETRKWLEEEVLAGEPAAAEGGQARDGAGPDPRARARRGALAQVAERLRAGEPQKAVEILMREAVQERSARDRFLRRAQAARIMVDAGMESVALPILKEMLEQIERHKLEEWEAGDTIAEPMGLLYRCLDRLQGDAATKEDLYVRVCRLDPIQAMSFAATGRDVDA